MTSQYRYNYTDLQVLENLQPVPVQVSYWYAPYPNCVRADVIFHRIASPGRKSLSHYLPRTLFLYRYASYTEENGVVCPQYFPCSTGTGEPRTFPSTGVLSISWPELLSPDSIRGRTHVDSTQGFVFIVLSYFCEIYWCCPFHEHSWVHACRAFPQQYYKWITHVIHVRISQPYTCNSHIVNCVCL